MVEGAANEQRGKAQTTTFSLFDAAEKGCGRHNWRGGLAGRCCPSSTMEGDGRCVG